MKETKMKPSERLMQVRNALDLQLRFADFAKTSTIIIDVYDAQLLLSAVEIVIDIVKNKEADNEQREAD